MRLQTTRIEGAVALTAGSRHTDSDTAMPLSGCEPERLAISGIDDGHWVGANSVKHG